MGLIQDWIKKLKEKKEEGEGYERTKHIGERYEEKRLSANERELLRFKKIEREAAIKHALEIFRRKEQDDMWRGKKNNPVYADNVVSNQKGIFKGNENLFLKKSSLFDKDDLFFKK